MIELVHLPVRRGNAPLRIARGHFATNHSHINYYIDITYQKTRLSEAKDSARQLVSHFINDTPVDTVLCLDGTAVLGTCVAEELTQTEVGYYFAALVLGLIGGMGASISSPLPLILMAVIVLVTAVLDTRLLNNDTEYVNITVDRAFTDTDELSEYLAVQFNVEVVSVRIARVDVLKDCTVVDAKLRRANRHRTRPEIENAAITGAPETGAPNTAISWSN